MVGLQGGEVGSRFKVEQSEIPRAKALAPSAKAIRGFGDSGFKVQEGIARCARWEIM